MPHGIASLLSKLCCESKPDTMLRTREWLASTPGKENAQPPSSGQAQRGGGALHTATPHSPPVAERAPSPHPCPPGVLQTIAIVFIKNPDAEAFSRSDALHLMYMLSRYSELVVSPYSWRGK